MAGGNTHRPDQANLQAISLLFGLPFIVPS
jgi:hypothetical protein